MARKTKLTGEIQRRIVTALRLGATKQLAAQYAGLAPETVETWLRKGEGGRAPYREFYRAVKLAEGELCVSALGRIVRASQDPRHWTAAAWLLERRFPKEYARMQALEIGPIEHGQTEGELARLLEARRELNAQIEAWDRRRAAEEAVEIEVFEAPQLPAPPPHTNGKTNGKAS